MYLRISKYFNIGCKTRDIIFFMYISHSLYKMSVESKGSYRLHRWMVRLLWPLGLCILHA